jgi:hypothetical protein
LLSDASPHGASKKTVAIGNTLLGRLQEEDGELADYLINIVDVGSNLALLTAPTRSL